jgi:anti-sigma factor RsiW
MDCCEFRELYSDYTDGLLDPIRKVDARAHLRCCEACRRFDAAFRAGIGALRSLPQAEVSPGFTTRLRSRLRHELSLRAPALAHWSGAFGTLLLIAAVGFVGWDLVGAGGTRPSSRAARMSGAHRAAATAWRAAAAAPRAGDTLAGVLDPFHPLQSLLMATPSVIPVTETRHPRYDLSVVWGGP